MGTQLSPVPVRSLRADVLEQVMRACDDEVSLLPFLVAEPGSREARVALGRLLSSAAVPLVPGCPLIVFAAGGELDPAWRAACPPAPQSLWSVLEFLTSLYGPVEAAADPYAALESLRLRAADDLGELTDLS